MSAEEKDLTQTWADLQELLETGAVINVKIAGVVKAGVIAYVDGIRGFIPASQLSVAYVENLEDWLEKTLDVKVITVEPETNRLVLSGRAVEQDKIAAEKASKMSSVRVGDVYDATVEKLMPFGAFVGFDGLSGLVHISQISTKRIQAPGEVLKTGDSVKVKVIGIKDGKLSLSIRALLDTDEAPRREVDTFKYKEEGKATTGLGSLLKDIKFD